MLAALDRWAEWKRMREAPGRIDAAEQRLAELEALVNGKVPGKHCPACGAPAMRRTSSEPDRQFGRMGGKREVWTCQDCGEIDAVFSMPK